MKSNKSLNGRWCAVRDTKTGGTIVEAIVVDCGVRLQTGEHFGEKRIRGEYELLELVELGCGKIPIIAELNEP